MRFPNPFNDTWMSRLQREIPDSSIWFDPLEEAFEDNFCTCLGGLFQERYQQQQKAANTAAEVSSSEA